MTLNTEIIALFNNNEVTNMDLNINVDVDDSYVNCVDVMEKSIDKEHDKYCKDSVNGNVTSEDKKIMRK